MSDDVIKERVRERLAAAELASVLGVSVGEVEDREEKPQWARWLVAATLLLGLGVAVGSAWLRSGDGEDSEAQNRGSIDVVNPWWHAHVKQFPPSKVRSAEGVAELADDVEQVAVSVQGATSPWLPDLQSKPELRRLSLEWTDEDSLALADWQAMARFGNLRCLYLNSLPRPEHLRELRMAPVLDSVMMIQAPASKTVVGRDVVGALAELPHLRMVAFGGVEMTAGAVRALAGLQNLDALLFEHVSFEGDLFASLSGMTQLRSLAMTRPQSSNAPRIDALAGLKRLRSLDMWGFELGDEDLRSLPKQLESLTLSRVSGVTPAGMSVLGQLPHLRSLGFHSSIPTSLHPVIAKVIEGCQLENFECRLDIPSAEIWRGLRASPRLRGLAIGAAPRENGAFAQQLRECARLEALGDLEIRLHSAPQPAELAVLRELKQLKTVRLLTRGFRLGSILTDVQRKALQTSLAPNIDIVFQR